MDALNIFGLHDRSREIALRLNEIYFAEPSMMRFLLSQEMARRGVGFLQGNFGIKKPFLTAQRPFLTSILIENPQVLAALKSEIVLTDGTNGVGLDGCWDGGGARTCVNAPFRTFDPSTALFSDAFSPAQIGGGLIMQLDIRNIREQLAGLLQPM